MQCTKLRERVRVYSRFLKVMDHLRALNNFNDLFAVKAAFSMTHIYRLKFTQCVFLYPSDLFVLLFYLGR